MTEYFGVTLLVLILIGVFRPEEITGFIDMSQYVTYITMYAFAGVALIFISYSVASYKREMDEQYEVAREALEAKSNFLANMSHEIRTPMNAIYGMAEILEGRESASANKEYIAVIKRSSENLLSIINEILDFSKVDSGKMEILEEPYEFNEMLQDVVSIIEFRMRDKNLRLLLNIDPNIPSTLIGDETRVRQILINLLNNAVKFTNQGSVTLDMKWRDESSMYNMPVGRMTIYVRDTGIGISEEEKERSSVIFNIRLLASYLFVESDGELSLPAFIALANELQSITPKFSEQLCKITMKRLTYEKISNLGIKWNDISEFKPELFAHHLFSYTIFIEPLIKPLVFEKYGTAFLSSNGIFLTYENSEDGKTLLKSGANSIETGNGCALRTTSALKLKKTDENNLIAMDRYVKDFILLQSKVSKPKIKKRLAEYEVGDTAIVRVSKIALDGTIHVETMDNSYQQMAGIIKFEKTSIVYY